MRILTSDLATGGCTVWSITDELRLQKQKTFGAKQRNLYAQKLCSFEWQGKNLILIGRKGLSIDIYDADDDFRCIKSKHLMTTQADSDFFISMEIIDDQFKACTGLGYCYFLSLDTLLTSCYNDFSMSFGLHGSVSFFKFLPISGNSNLKKVIVGGKDREISMIEIDTHSTIWKSKSIKKVDSLLEGAIQREPMWVQDVVLIPPEDSSYQSLSFCRIIAATRFGKLLVYDPNVTNYPIDELQVLENPIRHIRYLGKHLLIADAFNNVVILDHVTLKVVNRLKIPLGPLSSLSAFPLESSQRHSTSKFIVIATSSMDKKMRIYIFEDGYSTCMDCVDVNTTISEMVLVDTDTIPELLNDWLGDNTVKRHRL